MNTLRCPWLKTSGRIVHRTGSAYVRRVGAFSEREAAASDLGRNSLEIVCREVSPLADALKASANRIGREKGTEHGYPWGCYALCLTIG
jgi:hypothetical protein